jgi:hypothetical protein
VNSSQKSRHSLQIPTPGSCEDGATAIIPPCGMQPRAEATSHDPQKLPLQRGTTPHAARGAYRHRRRPLREEPTGSQLTAERAYPFGGVDLFLGAGGHGYRVPTRERSDQRHLARSEEDRVAVTIKL